eukprot:6192453-Pleurochrysis_carterae.AAC.3
MLRSVSSLQVTLGPKGRNVVLERSYGVPEVVNDGVTIARDIELDDPKANVGAKLLVEVASKTDQKAGDGTTTSTVLAQALVTEGLKLVASGANPIAIQRGLYTVRRAVEEATAAAFHCVQYATSLPGLTSPQISSAQQLCQPMATAHIPSRVLPLALRRCAARVRGVSPSAIDAKSKPITPRISNRVPGRRQTFLSLPPGHILLELSSRRPRCGLTVVVRDSHAQPTLSLVPLASP